jgi:predicted transcriptional regulator
MTDFLKVLGHTGLVRDTSSGAIINTNKTEYEEYMARMREAEGRENAISQHTVEINNIKNELQDIKSLILQLLNKD